MNSAPPEVRYDVVIAGGGIVGLTFARLLADYTAERNEALRIAILEPHPPTPKASLADQLRVSAVAPVAQQILQTTHTWQAIEHGDICAYSDMHIWCSRDASVNKQMLTFSARELGVPALGYIVMNKAMRTCAWSGLAGQPGITVHERAGPAALEAVRDGWRMTLADDSVCEARLLVAADGARSQVRELMGLQVSRREHHQQAIVAEIATEQPHRHTARQRFLRGGPLALLPLANGNCSLVWSCPDSQVAELLALSSADFSARLSGASDHVLGSLNCVSERLSFPLVSSQAVRYIDRRCALLGDAAHQVHPLAGQGLNLGLLDAAQLAAELAAHLRVRGGDPGDRLMLRRYERARKGDNQLTQHVLSSLNYVFGSDMAPAAAAGMSLLDKAGPLKRLLARYAMGQGKSAAVAPRPR